MAVEYPNAVLCLKEMAEMSMLSGLSEEHLHDEAWKFKELAQNIIDTTESVKNKAKLLYYDGKFYVWAGEVISPIHILTVFRRVDG